MIPIEKIREALRDAEYLKNCIRSGTVQGVVDGRVPPAVVDALVDTLTAMIPAKEAEPCGAVSFNARHVEDGSVCQLEKGHTGEFHQGGKGGLAMWERNSCLGGALYRLRNRLDG